MSEKKLILVFYLFLASFSPAQKNQDNFVIRTNDFTLGKAVSLYTQERDFIYTPVLPRRESYFLDNLIFVAGVSAGQETFIGAPKLGAYKEFAISKGRSGTPKFGFSKASVYVGAETSLFVFFAGVISISANAGFNLAFVTIDNSITRTLVSSPDNVKYSYTTYNPKLGIHIGPIWLKSGPSFALKQSEQMDGWLKLNGIHYNFELLFMFPN